MVVVGYIFNVYALNAIEIIPRWGAHFETVCEAAPTGSLVITHNLCFSAKDRLIMQVTASLKFIGLEVESVVGKVSVNARPHPGPLPEERGKRLQRLLRIKPLDWSDEWTNDPKTCQGKALSLGRGLGEGEQQNKLIRPLSRCYKTRFSTSQTGKKQYQLPFETAL